MATYFVSGHLDLTDVEFTYFYVPKLTAAIVDPYAKFVVGDAAGTDSIAQQWLYSRTRRVTVYHMFDTPRYNHGFPSKGGFTSDQERDEALTRDSDQDIAWVRPGREKSGTARNLARRRSKQTVIL